jgi:hypothetical protein
MFQHHQPSDDVVARKPNYDFEKRKKELDRKAKKEEKLRRKREGAATADDGTPVERGDSAVTDPE